MRDTTLYALLDQWRAEAAVLHKRGAVLHALGVESCADDLEAVLEAVIAEREGPSSLAPRRCH